MSWFRRAKDPPTAGDHVEATAAPPVQLTLTERVRSSELAMAEARKELALVTRRLARARERRDKAVQSTAEAQRDLGDARTVAKSFEDWRIAASQSWAVGLVSAAAGERARLLVDLHERRERLRRPPPINLSDLGDLHRRFVRGLLASIIVVVLSTVVVAIVAPSVQEKEWSRPWVDYALRVWAISLLVGVVVVAVIVFGLLTKYYRELSRRRQAIRQHASWIDSMYESVRHLRAERVRLESLGGQMPGYLLMMSEIVHRPWVLPVGRSALVPVPRPDLTRLPGHVRLAEPVIEAGVAHASAREAIALEFRPGWRVEAFNDLLEICARSLTFTPGAFAEEVLNTNAAQREILTDHLLNRVPGDVEYDDHSQVLLGRQTVRKIARSYREALLGGPGVRHLDAFPLVVELSDDPVSGADTRADQLSEIVTKRRTQWNAFLLELLKSTPELSWFDLSDEAKGDLHHGREDAAVRALCMGPERLTPNRPMTGLTFVPLDTSVLPPVEIMLRLDHRQLSGPEALYLFQGGQGVRVERPLIAASGIDRSNGVSASEATASVKDINY